MAVNIWAYRNDTGTWNNDSNSGWDKQFEFSDGWPEIVERLRALKVKNSVAKLAVVAHGDKAGLVKLNPDFTPAMVTPFRTEISQLGEFLTQNGKLMFCACVAGQGDAGSDLLNRMSVLIPNRNVIGFEVQGQIASLGQPNRTGVLKVYNQRGNLPAHVVTDVVDEKGGRNLSEYSWFSKWSLNGKIIHLPFYEQGSNDKKRCGSPNCPGHDRAGQQCQKYFP
jgi:Domain of unknown function (DUF4347)